MTNLTDFGVIMKRALIIHAGKSCASTVKSIESVKPDLVYFIHSADHEDAIAEIEKQTELEFETRTCLVNDFQSIEESFTKSLDIFRQLKGEDYDIHVGISNGTKAMVVGLAMASVGYDCGFLYVGSVEGGRDENGLVKEGSEKAFDEFRPMSHLVTIDISRAKRYFNNYQFAEAIAHFEKAAQTPYNRNRMEMYVKIAKLYQQWDKFENMIPYVRPNGNISSTTLDYYLRTAIKKEIDEDDSLKDYFYTYESEFMKTLEDNLEFLDKKISKKGKIKEGDVYYYLPDLLNNAWRRIEEEKFDDATARLYRVTELIAQIRLYEHGIIEEKRLEDMKVFRIEKEDIVRNYPMNVIEYISKNRDFANSKKKTVKLVLAEDFELLEILGDEVALKFMNDKKIFRVLTGRNNSILAHGFVPAKREDSEELFERLVDYGRDTFDELDECMKHSMFPKFRDIYD